MDRRQPQLLAHVHPAVEAEGDIERIEHQIREPRIEIAELGREPRPPAARAAACADAGRPADRRRDRAHALGEVPHRQPFLEQLGAVRTRRSMRLDSGARSSTGRVDRTPAHRQIEGRGIEIGEAGEVLEQRAAGNAGNGGDRGRGRFDVAGLDEIERRLDQRLTRPQAATMRPSCERETSNGNPIIFISNQ
jgi:hypothetical protein